MAIALLPLLSAPELAGLTPELRRLIDEQARDDARHRLYPDALATRECDSALGRTHSGLDGLTDPRDDRRIVELPVWDRDQHRHVPAERRLPRLVGADRPWSVAEARYTPGPGTVCPGCGDSPLGPDELCVICHATRQDPTRWPMRAPERGTGRRRAQRSKPGRQGPAGVPPRPVIDPDRLQELIRQARDERRKPKPAPSAPRGRQRVRMLKDHGRFEAGELLWLPNVLAKEWLANGTAEKAN